MASKLARIRDRVRAALGPVNPSENDVLRCLESGSVWMLPMVQPERRQTAREAARALEHGWTRDAGRRGLRRALREAAELDEQRPIRVAPELVELHAALVRLIEEAPDPFD